MNPTLNDNSNPQQGTGNRGGAHNNHHATSTIHSGKIDRSKPRMPPPTVKDERKVFVGGLPGDVSLAEFRDFFAQHYGPVLDAVIMMDRFTHRSRGFGFVTFESAQSSRKLLSGADGSRKMELWGKVVEIKAAEPKPKLHTRVPNPSTTTAPTTTTTTPPAYYYPPVMMPAPPPPLYYGNDQPDGMIPYGYVPVYYAPGYVPDPLFLADHPIVG